MSDNVKTFTKEKRLTPEELVFPISHECMSGHQSLKWMLQVKENALHAVCSDCATSFNLIDLMEHTLGEDDD